MAASVLTGAIMDNLIVMLIHRSSFIQEIAIGLFDMVLQLKGSHERCKKIHKKNTRVAN